MDDKVEDDEPVEKRRQDTQSDTVKKRKKPSQPSPDQDTQSDMVKKRKKKAQPSPDVTNPKQKQTGTDVPPLKLTCEIVLKALKSSPR
jgi:hypothetical protein